MTPSMPMLRTLLPMQAPWRTLFVSVALSASLLGSCATSGSQRTTPKTSGVPSSITLRDYRNGLAFVIVNDSHLSEKGVKGDSVSTRRALFYSELNQDQLTKVADDELVEGILTAFRQRGFEKLAQAGLAPTRSSGSTTSIQVTKGRTSQHLAFNLQLSASGQRTYGDCRRVFFEVYNALDQYTSASTIPEQTTGVRGPKRP